MCNETQCMPGNYLSVKIGWVLLLPARAGPTHAEAYGQKEADNQHTAQLETTAAAIFIQIMLSITIFEVKREPGAYRKQSKAREEM